MSYNIEDTTREKWEHAGFTCRIVWDDNPMNPREDFDHPSTLVFSSHLGHSLGDEEYDADYLDRTIDCPVCEGSGLDPRDDTDESSARKCPNEGCDNGTVYLPTLAEKLMGVEEGGDA